MARWWVFTQLTTVARQGKATTAAAAGGPMNLWASGVYKRWYACTGSLSQHMLTSEQARARPLYDGLRSGPHAHPTSRVPSFASRLLQSYTPPRKRSYLRVSFVGQEKPHS